MTTDHRSNNTRSLLNPHHSIHYKSLQDHRIINLRTQATETITFVTEIAKGEEQIEMIRKVAPTWANYTWQQEGFCSRRLIQPGSVWALSHNSLGTHNKNTHTHFRETPSSKKCGSPDKKASTRDPHTQIFAQTHHHHHLSTGEMAHKQRAENLVVVCSFRPK